MEYPKQGGVVVLSYGGLSCGSRVELPRRANCFREALPDRRRHRSVANPLNSVFTAFGRREFRGQPRPEEIDGFVLNPLFDVTEGSHFQKPLARHPDDLVLLDWVPEDAMIQIGR